MAGAESDGGIDRSAGGEDWEYQVGETLIEDSEGPDFDIAGPPSDHEPTEYTVKRRLCDPDDDLRFYYLEWERETAGGPSIENLLQNADLVRLHYSAIETEGADAE